MAAAVVIYRAVAPSGKCYIWQTRNWPRRKQQHIRAAANGTHHNRAFAAALRKYGNAVKWRVIVRIPPEWANEDGANAAEAELIRRHNTLAPNGYNLREGGDVAPITEAQRRAISAAKIGKPLTPAHRSAISAGNSRRWADPNNRAAMSATKKGKPGHKQSAASRRKISESKRGAKYPNRKRPTPCTAEHRANLSKATAKAWARRKAAQ